MLSHVKHIVSHKVTCEFGTVLYGIFLRHNYDIYGKFYSIYSNTVFVVYKVKHPESKIVKMYTLKVEELMRIFYENIRTFLILKKIFLI